MVQKQFIEMLSIFSKKTYSLREKEYVFQFAINSVGGNHITVKNLFIEKKKKTSKYRRFHQHLHQT